MIWNHKKLYFIFCYFLNYLKYWKTVFFCCCCFLYMYALFFVCMHYYSIILRFEIIYEFQLFVEVVFLILWIVKDIWLNIKSFCNPFIYFTFLFNVIWIIYSHIWKVSCLYILINYSSSYFLFFFSYLGKARINFGLKYFN